MTDLLRTQLALTALGLCLMPTQAQASRIFIGAAAGSQGYLEGKAGTEIQFHRAWGTDFEFSRTKITSDETVRRFVPGLTWSPHSRAKIRIGFESTTSNAPISKSSGISAALSYDFGRELGEERSTWFDFSIARTRYREPEVSETLIQREISIGFSHELSESLTVGASGSINAVISGATPQGRGRSGSRLLAMKRNTGALPLESAFQGSATYFSSEFTSFSGLIGGSRARDGSGSSVFAGLGLEHRTSESWSIGVDSTLTFSTGERARVAAGPTLIFHF